MLATTWHVFGVGTTYEYPDDFQHYFVYWVGPFMAAITASIIYVIYGTLLPGRDICMIAAPDHFA
jgi:glycerol uptake facilitator-like aquaporin